MVDLLHAWLLRARNLVREHDLATLVRRLQHGQANLKRGLAPSSVGKCRPILRHGLMELAQLGRAPGVARTRNLLTAGLGVDENSLRRLPDGAALAGHDGQPEK